MDNGPTSYMEIFLFSLVVVVVVLWLARLVVVYNGKALDMLEQQDKRISDLERHARGRQ